MDWLDQDLGLKTVEEREELLKRNLGEKVKRISWASDRISLLEDSDGDGKADKASVFAEGFNRLSDGCVAGVWARKGNVFFTCIPDLVLLKDTDGDGKADVRKTLLHGFGVRTAYLGHDLHGPCIGMDGKIYFTVGDRAYNVTSQEGKNFAQNYCGACFRCNQDGSEFEVFATGLRNPQGLAIDNYGNIFTGDNNADRGDSARWVYIVEGGDSGWRGGYQYINWPNALGAWNSEKLWGKAVPGQAAYIVPPVEDIGVGPSGCRFYPGTGLPVEFNDHFFYCDYRGEGGGILSFALKPKGASYELVDQKNFFWRAQATDLVFGVNGGAYISVWYGGISKTGKGRVYRLHDPKLDADSLVLETKKLLAEDLTKRPEAELAGLLAHADQRVRQEAQFALVEKGAAAIATFTSVAQKKENQLARLHAIWGLGMIGRKTPAAFDAIVSLLADEDGEVRAQAAKVLGDGKCAKAFDGLMKLLADPFPRAQFFAAQSLGKLGKKEALDAGLAMLKANTANDAFIRHAGLMAILGMNDKQIVLGMAKDASPAVRMVSLLAMRRLEMAEIAQFLNDSESALIVEAARAINDVPISAAMPALAGLIAKVAPIASKSLVMVDGPNGPAVFPAEIRQSDAVFLRVVNAQFRLGTPLSPIFLAHYAASNDGTVKARTAALMLLTEWPKPSQRDLIVGLYRPLESRNAEQAVNALKTEIAYIIQSAPPEVRTAAIAAAEQLRIKEAAPALLEIVGDAKHEAKTRIAALKALAATGDVRLEQAVQIAVADKNDQVRSEGNKLKAQLNPAGAGAVLAEILEKSASVAERQGALSALGATQDAKADEVLAGWLEKLIAGQAPAELQLDILEAASKRNGASVKAALEKYNAQVAALKDDPFAGFRETLNGGDAAAGKKVFFEKIEASCMRCHKIGEQGGDAGPALSDVGAKKDRAFMLESILYPNKQIAQGFESLIVKQKSGKTVVGILKKETEKELELNVPPEGIVKIAKDDVASSKRGQSLMPEELGKILSKQDIRNLVEFLASQKGGAEKGHGAAH
jgi:quinoprotein glucose dehydrogenase